MGPVRQCLKDAGRRAQGHRRGRAGRRHDPHAEDPAAGARTTSARSPTRASTPTRSWRSAPRSRPGILAGEVKDVLLLDVTPAVARRRDAGRRDDASSSSATPRSRPRRPRSSRPRPTARPPSRSTSCRASARWRRDNRTLGKFHLVGHPARAARRAADRGHVRHRRQRHPERLGEGPATGKTQAITITASSGLAKDEVEKMVKEAAGARRARTRRSASSSTCATRPTPSPTASRSSLKREPREARRGRGQGHRGGGRRGAQGGRGRGRGGDQGRHGAADEAQPQAGRGRSTRRPAGRPREPRGPGGRAGAGQARRATSWTPSTR